MALLHGFHREAYPNGDSYEGHFKKGARHGAGTYYDAGGPHYEGQFCEGLMEGAGTYYYHRHEVYEGEWHAGKRHGAGRFKYSDGAVYHGQWQNDLRHGTGRMREADGAVFEGQWLYDQRCGQGKLAFADGGCYEGDWAKDSPVFEGQWLYDQRCGKGKLAFADGGCCEGGWAKDRRHGVGVVQLANGGSYNGKFQDDIAEGEGVLFDAVEKSQYSGQFKDASEALEDALELGTGVVVVGTVVGETGWQVKKGGLEEMQVKMGIERNGTVVGETRWQVKVHYDGFGKEDDEWLARDSDRIIKVAQARVASGTAHEADAAGYVMMSEGSVVFSETPRSSSAGSEKPGRTREVCLVVSRDSVHDLLGLHMKHSGGRLRVVGIHSDAAAWRSSAASVAAGGDGLEPGDVIVRINGVSGDADAMVRECQERATLVVHALRALDPAAAGEEARKSRNAVGSIFCWC